LHDALSLLGAMDAEISERKAVLKSDSKLNRASCRKVKHCLPFQTLYKLLFLETFPDVNLSACMFGDGIFNDDLSTTEIM
jgi:hypothetical protein